MSSAAKDFDAAMEDYAAGRWREAERACARLVARDETNARAWHLRGAAAARQGRTDEALGHISRAVAADADFAPAWLDLAQLLLALKRDAEAIDPLFHLARLHPDDAAVRCRLSNMLLEQNRLAAAEAVAREAIRLQPESVAAHINLGAALHRQGRLEEAIAAYGAALAAEPHNALAASNLGEALGLLGRFAEAEAAVRRAVELEPQKAAYWLNLSSVRTRTGRHEEALAAAGQASQLDPADHRARVNAGMALLTLGRWSEGLREFEFRTRSLSPCAPGRRVWNGSALGGRPIVLRAEQGFGDTIQFVRYAPLLRERFGAGRLILECPDALKRLMTSAAGVDQVLAPQDARSEQADLEVYVMSLPHRFGTTPQTVPADVPYLRARPQDVDRLRPLVGTGNALRVGLVWAGNPAQADDRRRSCALATLAPLLEVAGVEFFSLQKGAAADLDGDMIRRLGLRDLGSACTDLADLAAAMKMMDLIISVCTAPAHLAGALALPVWTLLPHVADWRWLLGRSDTPWYPTMRLFRQPAHGDWGAVVRDVYEALRVHLATK